MDCEIIDFYTPDGNDKNIFVGNLPLETEDFNPTVCIKWHKRVFQ